MDTCAFCLHETDMPEPLFVRDFTFTVLHQLEPSAEQRAQGAALGIPYQQVRVGVTEQEFVPGPLLLCPPCARDFRHQDADPLLARMRALCWDDELGVCPGCRARALFQAAARHWELRLN